MTGTLLRFEGVSLGRDGAAVLRDVDLDVPDEGITVVVGASGAGKSTLLRCANRLEAPTAGRVLYRGDDVQHVEPRHLRRRVGMVFQAPTTFPGTVAQNLRAVVPSLPEEEVEALLGRVGLDPGLRDRTADTLSGGEAQRMAVGRALTTGPDALLADEPTSALDARATERLEVLARTLADDGMPMLWVTHDLGQARRLGDHLVVMRAGAVTWTGHPAGDTAAAAIDDALRGDGA